MSNDLDQRISDQYENWIKRTALGIVGPSDGFEAGFKAALPRWIPVSERRPKYEGRYLVAWKNGDHTLMHFRPEKRSYSDSGWFVDAKTNICWKGMLPVAYLNQPIPHPPEEQDDDDM